MRNQRAGQATFIPLDTIQVKPINDKFRSFAKGARLAVDVIQHEAAIERAIHHACWNALVYDTMEVAKGEYRSFCVECRTCWQIRWSAVTLEGTIIHKSGLITGGRSSHGNNKKWDEKDVQGTLIDHFPINMSWISFDRFDSGARYIASWAAWMHQRRAKGKSDENLHFRDISTRIANDSS